MPENQFQRMVFAFFTQLFFIQPLIRTVFKKIFVRNTEQAPEQQEAKAA